MQICNGSCKSIGGGIEALEIKKKKKETREVEREGGGGEEGEGEAEGDGEEGAGQKKVKEKANVGFVDTLGTSSRSGCQTNRYMEIQKIKTNETRQEKRKEGRRKEGGKEGILHYQSDSQVDLCRSHEEHTEE